MRRLAILSIGFALLGCGAGADESSGPEILPDLELEAAPANSFQLITPIVHNIQPGNSYEFCTWTDMILEKDMEVKGATGFQTALGHHVALFYTNVPKPAGTTRECTDDDMTSFRFVVGTGGEGFEVEAPGNLVYHIPQGAQIVLNHHYLNATTSVKSGQSAANVRLSDPGTDTVRAGAVAFLDSTIRVPPGTSSLDIGCTMSRDMNMWYVIPHMHRWGKHIIVDKVSAGQTENLFDLDWDESWTFDPPEIKRDINDPFQLKVGDQINIHCDWYNPNANDLTFGLEMCVAFGQTINAEQLPNIACDKGEWVEF